MLDQVEELKPQGMDLSKDTFESLNPIPWKQVS